MDLFCKPMGPRSARGRIAIEEPIKPPLELFEVDDTALAPFRSAVAVLLRFRSVAFGANLVFREMEFPLASVVPIFGERQISGMSTLRARVSVLGLNKFIVIREDHERRVMLAMLALSRC